MMFPIEELGRSLQKMQGMALEMQKKLQDLRATAEAGAGLVRATIDGHKKLVALDVDDSLLQPEHKVMLQDLVVAAYALAHEEMERRVKQELQSQGGPLGPEGLAKL